MSWFGLVQKSPVRSGLHAQLPVWLNLCASAKYASLLRRASSARLRSSMSVVTPYHLTMFPSSSRSGTPRSTCQRSHPDEFYPSPRTPAETVMMSSSWATDRFNGCGQPPKNEDLNMLFCRFARGRAICSLGAVRSRADCDRRANFVGKPPARSALIRVVAVPLLVNTELG